MDLGTLIGLLGGFGVVLGAIVLGGSALIFLNPPSILVVFGGTIGAAMMKFTLGKFLGAFKVAAKAFMYKSDDPNAIIEEAVSLADVARKEGLLSLQDHSASNDFLQKGLQLCLDGHDPELVKNILTRDMELTLERHANGSQIFRAIGDVAPAMGMIGTLIGLVQMLSSMDDPKKIGPAMAIALLTTLYGAMIANMLALPIADKLEFRMGEERLNMSLIIESIDGIQQGLNPRVLGSMLKSYLPSKQRGPEDDEV